VTIRPLRRGDARAVDAEPAAQWEGLPVGWREAFELAWAAMAAGSPPVGAVVVDGRELVEYAHVLVEGRADRLTSMGLDSAMAELWPDLRRLGDFVP
jgi:hypothetical protein